MLDLILLYIVSFSGVFFGKLLRKVAYEEVKFGEKYLLNFQHFILFILALSLVYFADFNPWFIVLFVLGFIASFLFRKKYFYLGLALVAASFSQESLILVASLVFIYGLSFGSLSKKLLSSSIYFVIALILASLLLFNLPSANNYLLYFIAGSLFLRH